ncbi:hypothetical protein D9758_002628 [Tetrapyrgos nigripes]|uniref:Uncharacterized protein n=1 Tax=Tetrapyrgos nigripes TaxID=182062 RepID=A0A8H5GQK2_9AGAR|nr:hypothetical protein D9758_002628 [Tetrapyrgos nigripes]
MDYTPLSLTTISTPHRGSPFMDWCAENLGLGKKTEDGKKVTMERATSAMAETAAESKLNLSTLSSLPSSFTTLLLSILDSPAYSNLTTDYLQNIFNPSTLDDPKVKYFSVTSRVRSVSIWHPFWFPKMVVDEWEKEERERLCKVWESTPHANPSNSDEPPLFANDLEWGNDGLVAIQSAKWGEFLGVLEGCDHWESRGSRGIEFGVDLPGIPSLPSIPSIPVPKLRLGSFSFTSFDERSKRKASEAEAGAATGNGNGREVERSRGSLGIGFGSSFGEWSFGTQFGNQDLGRFMKLWWREEREAKQREAQERESERKSREATQGQGYGHENGHRHTELGDNEMESAFESGSQVSLSSTSSHSSPSFQAQARRKLDRERDDEVIKASTEKLSRVFEWFSTSEKERQERKEMDNGKEQAEPLANKADEKKTSDPSSNPVLHYSSSSSSSPPSHSSSSSPSSNFPGKLKNSGSGSQKEAERRERHSDLATKADLERFYVALSRKLWDEGL